MLKKAFVELNPDMDCIGSVTAFEYVILEGQIEAMETGAALLMSACDGPPIMVAGTDVRVGCSTTSSTHEVRDQCYNFSLYFTFTFTFQLLLM
jgi:hypothetical protein